MRFQWQIRIISQLLDTNMSHECVIGYFELSTIRSYHAIAYASNPVLLTQLLLSRICSHGESMKFLNIKYRLSDNRFSWVFYCLNIQSLNEMK